MSSEWGKNLRISVFGRSHEEYVGIDVEGLPKGEYIDMQELIEFMHRRSPGREGTSGRKESDTPVFIRGVEDGCTDGKILTVLIYNEDVESKDYVNLKDVPRPGHADYPAYIKYGGNEDMRGGGRFSGRLTAPICAAGGIVKQILHRRGISVDAELITDYTADDGDSAGGIVSCTVSGLPVGLGDALFDGIDGSVSSIVFGIPAVKGIEFGAGFKAASLKGSENNDEYFVKDRKVVLKTNNSGGVLGGMTNGMPLTFNVAFKPTPSISKKQSSVNLKTMEETDIEITGRHDPCVAVRAVPVVEACAAIAVLDAMPVSDLSNARSRIDSIDRRIASLLVDRFKLTDSIGEMKRKDGLPVEDIKRENEVLENAACIAGEEFAKEVSEVYSNIIELSKKRQWNSD